MILVSMTIAEAQNELPHQRCIDEPTVPCLIVLALAQTKCGDLRIADMSNRFRVIAQIQANSGDLAGATETASNLGARKLLLFTTEDLTSKI